MTAPDAELQRMLQEAYRLEGRARWAAVDTVLRHADAAGALKFAFEVRMDALWPLQLAQEYARSIMAFSACLATLDAHPEVVAEHRVRSLLWAYKWMIGSVTQFPGISLERAYSLVDDMERRYREGGHSLHAVHQHRAYIAEAVGDLVEAGRLFELMGTARRDSLSDCVTCVPSSVVGYLVAAGEDEKAITVATPHLDGVCAHQPQWLLSHVLKPYLRTGRLAEAATAHRRALERTRGRPVDLDLMALHLDFWALTGNEQTALPVLERLLPQLDSPGSPRNAMDFATSAALVARRLVETGHSMVEVRRRSLDGTRTWSSTVEELRDELAALARGIAAEFDARNGNAYISGLVEAGLAAEPLVAELPLSIMRGRPLTSPVRAKVGEQVDRLGELVAAGDRTGAARAQLDLAYALRNAGQNDDAIETAEEARRGLDDLGLADEAMTARYLLVELYGRANDRPRVRALVDELLAAPALPASVGSRAELLQKTAHRLDGQRAVEQLVEASALFRAAGEVEGEVRCLEQLLGFVDEPVPAEIVARFDELIEHFPADDLEYVHERLCHLEILAGMPAAALQRATRHGLRPTQAEVLLALGHHAEAEEIARDLLLDGGGEGGWRALRVIAKILRAQGRDDEFAAFAHEHRITDLDGYLDDDVE